MKIKGFEFNMFGETTYVVWDSASREAAIIDPGMMNDRERLTLDKFIADNNLKIKYLINTHLHVDHIMGDKYVTEKYGVGVSAHPADRPLADRVKQQVAMFHLPVNVDDVVINTELGHGDRLMLGNEPLDVIHVPGHTPGGIALYAPQSGFVVSGDSLFAGGIGRTDLPGGDYPTLINAINTRLMTLPDDTTVYPGHAGSTTIGAEKRYNPYLR